MSTYPPNIGNFEPILDMVVRRQINSLVIYLDRTLYRR